MAKIGLIGLGKMGLSHLAILNARKDVEVRGICDTSKFMVSGMRKFTPHNVYTDYKKMLSEEEMDAVVIASPTRLHKEMVVEAIDRNLGVFLEKPMTLKETDSQELLAAVTEQKVPNQVGYHNRFIATFCKAKLLVHAGAIGDVYHVDAESYGPVVIREAVSTWRSDRNEGGGCLFDYASHVINILQYCIGPPMSVAGTVLQKVFSTGVEDAVYSTLMLGNASCQLSVNWSDETYRKMTTRLTIFGKKGKIIVDAHEVKVYSKADQPELGLERGWNIGNITTMAPRVDYHLRGEEYTIQIDHFVECVKAGKLDSRNSFAESYQTEKIIAMLAADGE